MTTITAISSDEQWHALRSKVVGASEAGALVGEHEYLSYWGLWARKSGKLPPVEDNLAMERGRRLEPVAIDMIRDRFPEWDVVLHREHFADEQFGIGATPDMIVHDKERGQGVIQIKSVAPSVFRRNWRGDSDAIKVPTWIAIQALMEAELTGSKWAVVAALVVDHEIGLHMQEIALHPGIVEKVKDEALVFWQRVFNNDEPDPDYRRDSALIRAALKVEDGSEIDLSGDAEVMLLLSARESLMASIKEDEAKKKEIDGRLMHRMGNAAVARFDGGRITLKTVNKAAHQVKASSYRSLRVFHDGVRRSEAETDGHRNGEPGAHGEITMSAVIRQNQVAEIRAQLDRQLGQFAAVLPKHIPAERFARVVLTAVQNSPELLDVDRRSLLNACMRAAQDGLLPDGRLGAIVVYQGKGGIKTASWLPMVAGLRQKVRNSGEISDWNAHVVRANDAFDYEEGDNPHILHRPVRGDRGPVVAAYSIARFKTGEISREWMWIEELDKVRATSKAQRGPWADWPDEMYRKTVAKRHAKVLPMSSDLDDLLRRPDEPSGGEGSGDVRPLVVSGQASPPAALNEALDALAAPRRGAGVEEFDSDTGEVIDAGEYADSDDEQLPLAEKPKKASEGP